MKLLEPFTFVTDRCLGKHDVPGALRAALTKGETLERLDDHYAPDALDEKWIPEVGAKKWVILTKDDALRRNPLETQAMLAAETGVFIFGNANVKAAQIADAFTKALPRIRKALRRFDVPVLARVGVGGDVSVLWIEGEKQTPAKALK